jgi:hypothetical protein
MRFYAERPGRVLRQLLADVSVVVWTWVTVLVALRTRELIDRLQAPGRALAEAGTDIRDAFETAATTAQAVPFVGDALADALLDAAGAGGSLSEAGRDQVASVATFSVGAAVLVVAVFAVPVVVVWAALRLRYARLAGAAAAIRDSDTDLLALRALARVPVRRLLTVAPDPAGAWRRADPAAVARLAALELRSLGFRAPTEQPGPSRGTGPDDAHERPNVEHERRNIAHGRLKRR